MSLPVRPFSVASTDGVELQAYDYGGSGPILLFCHATGFCGRAYDPMIEAMASDFHCFGFDFRAHGLSTPPDGGPDAMQWGGMGDDVLAMADAISPGEAILGFGHSMGGAALILAETARPGTLRGAWTFEPIVFPGTGAASVREPSPLSQGALRRRAVFTSREEAYNRFGSRPPLSLLDARCLAAYVDYGLIDSGEGFTLACPPEYEAAVFELHNSGAWERAAELAIPFTVAASGDGERPAESVTELAGLLPHLDLATYKSLTHFGPLQDPVALVADMTRTLKPA